MKKFLIVVLLGVISSVGYGQNVKLDKANELINNEDFIKAHKLLNEFIAKDSTVSEAFANRAKCLMKKGKYDEALEDLSYAIKLDSLNPNAYCGLGSVHAITGQVQLSLLNFKMALTLDSGHVDSYNSRGALKFYFLKDYEGAMADYNRALELAPEDDYALYNRGILFNYLENFEKAYLDLSKSIRYKDKQADAYYARGRSSLFLGNYKIAIKDFKKTIKYNNPIGPFGRIDNGEVFYNIGYCYQELNKQSRAKRFFNKAARLGYE